MGKFRDLPGAGAAVGAFALTVTLGVGGASASALWQQSATATMTVSAATIWPGDVLTGFTCTNNNNRTHATLTATGTKTPASLTYAALQADGSYGPSYNQAVTLGASSTVTLDITSPIVVANRFTARLTIRVTATYSDQSTGSATAVLDLEQGNNSNKVTCVSTSL